MEEDRIRNLEKRVKKLEKEVRKLRKDQCQKGSMWKPISGSSVRGQWKIKKPFTHTSLNGNSWTPKNSSSPFMFEMNWSKSDNRNAFWPPKFDW